MTPRALDLPVLDPSGQLGAVTWPMIAAGTVGLLILAAAVTALIWAARRTIRAVAAAVESGRLTTRRVLITVAIVAALGVAGIGGARSFAAVSTKFDSPLVPLVADGMIIACTSLRLAALTRGWRIPGALVTTYVFIGGTVWLNVDTASGVADAIAHALAPLAYAVLVEMLAHLLRLHMKLAQPAKPRLSALTWITSPVITSRVWLHLSRTGADDPAAARALVQQVVRMASRLATLCPSRRLWPLDAARAARTACLQTIRDGLLSASELAALLPAGGRLAPGELLALVDTAALGLTASVRPAEPRTTGSGETGRAAIEQIGAPLWLFAYLLGALRTESESAPVHASDRTAPPAPVHCDTQSSASAPLQSAHRTTGRTDPAAAHASDDRSDDELLALVRQHAAAEHDGGPLSQRAIRRVTGVGTPRARRLAELAGWTEPTDDAEAPAPQVRGQLEPVAEPGENIANPEHESDDNTIHELETSSSR
jgi:hypothetical protein